MACQAHGRRLCTKAEVQGAAPGRSLQEQCLAGWMSDGNGMYLTEDLSGCAAKGWHELGTASSGAWCCPTSSRYSQCKWMGLHGTSTPVPHVQSHSQCLALGKPYVAWDGQHCVIPTTGRTDGRCTRAIATPEECITACQATDYTNCSDITVDNWESEYPSGCFWHADKGLYFNTNEATVGGTLKDIFSFGLTVHNFCSTTNQCLCAEAVCDHDDDEDADDSSFQQYHNDKHVTPGQAAARWTNMLDDKNRMCPVLSMTKFTSSSVFTPYPQGLDKAIQDNYEAQECTSCPTGFEPRTKAIDERSYCQRYLSFLNAHEGAVHKIATLHAAVPPGSAAPGQYDRRILQWESLFNCSSLDDLDSSEDSTWEGESYSTSCTAWNKMNALPGTDPVELDTPITRARASVEDDVAEVLDHEQEVAKARQENQTMTDKLSEQFHDVDELAKEDAPEGEAPEFNDTVEEVLDETGDEGMLGDMFLL